VYAKISFLDYAFVCSNLLFKDTMDQHELFNIAKALLDGFLGYALDSMEPRCLDRF
jgi:hypothetical protein